LEISYDITPTTLETLKMLDALGESKTPLNAPQGEHQHLGKSVIAGYSVAEKGVRVVSMCYLALVSNISALWLSLIFIIISAIAVFLFDRSCSWSKADRMYLYKRRCEEEGVPVGKGPVTYFRWGIPVMIHQAIVLINFLPQIIEMLK
jgi:hypothetical protein